MPMPLPIGTPVQYTRPYGQNRLDHARQIATGVVTATRECPGGKISNDGYVYQFDSAGGRTEDILRQDLNAPIESGGQYDARSAPDTRPSLLPALTGLDFPEWQAMQALAYRMKPGPATPRENVR